VVELRGVEASRHMKLISWNVNGVRAILGKGFRGFFDNENADIVCLQETKARPEQVDVSWMEGYHAYWNAAEKPGYSGTVVFCKNEPLSEINGIGVAEHDTEGRVVTLEFPDFYLVNVYTPNAQNGLRRLPYRQKWDRDFLAYLKKLETKRPVAVCGDFNVAHEEIDLARPKQNRKNAGFSDEERAGFSALIDAGFVDTFREFESGGEHYSWWSYRANARANNVGWRIDYWCVSQALRERLERSWIMSDVLGSDHCPVAIELR